MTLTNTGKTTVSLTFIDLVSEVNVIFIDFAKKFGLPVCKSKFSTQKIDGLKLDIFDIVIAFFPVEDKKSVKDTNNTS